MKLKKLKLKNFALFTDFECHFNGKVTNLVGVNGSGKTTVGLTSIWACLKGIAEKSRDGQLIGERFRFIGSAKPTADIELILIDEARGNAEIKVKNHITTGSNQISFTPPKNYPMDESWLRNLLSVAFLSAKNFTQQSSKEQALLLGINASKFDNELQELKNDYTDINRGIRRIGELVKVEKVESVSVSELLNEKEKIDNFNSDQESIQEDIKVVRQQLELTKEKIKDLKYQLEMVQKSKAHFEQEIKDTIQPEPLKSTKEIIAQIQGSEAINNQAHEYKIFVEQVNQKTKLRIELDNNTTAQSRVQEKRLKYIQSFKFGFDSLSVNEKGELLLDNRPIKEPLFSKGELELIVAKLYASLNPELKVRFIDDFELLDEKNQKKILDELLEQGFQIITACVGEKVKNKDNSILLKECKQVTNYEGELLL